jgi:hypothetical protein
MNIFKICYKKLIKKENINVKVFSENFTTGKVAKDIKSRSFSHLLLDLFEIPY